MLGEEALSHNNQEMEDDEWSNFRLPIPIPFKGRRNSNQREWLIKVIDQLRLLQTMKEELVNTEYGPSNRLSSKHQRMKGQMNLVLSGQARIEDLPIPLTTTNTTQNDDDNDTQQPIFYENAHLLVKNMRQEAEDICHQFHEWLCQHPEQMKENIIANIFFAPLTEPMKSQDEPLYEFSYNSHDDTVDNDDHLQHTGNAPVSDQTQYQKRSHSAVTERRYENQRKEDIDPVEFQRQQQELLEEELSSMATRLKSSTLAMNATLQTQTKDLEGMEDIAQANLDNVSSTAKKVEQRLAKKKGWRKKLATWSLIFTVIGMWTLCFMITRTVPKRKIDKGRLDWKNLKIFITDKAGQLKDKLDMLLNGESFDPHWEQSSSAQQNRQRQKPQQRQQNSHMQECEILSDGSQECRDRQKFHNPDAKAQQLLAERKQRRIEENMANARTVDAIDPAELRLQEDEIPKCIPYTSQMNTLQQRLHDFANTRNSMTEMFESSPNGSNERKSYLLKLLQRLHSDYREVVSALDVAQNAARIDYSANKGQAPKEDIPFCSAVPDTTGLEQNQDAWAAFEELIKSVEEEARKVAQEAAAKEAEEAKKKAEEAAAAAESRKIAEERAAKKRAEEARKRAEEIAAAEERAAKKRTEEARRRAEEIAAAEARKLAEEIAEKKAEEEAAAEALKKAEAEAAAKKLVEEEAAAVSRKRAEEEAIAEAAKKAEQHQADLLNKIRLETRKAREEAQQVEDEDFRASDLRFAASRGQNSLLAYYISEMPQWINSPDAGGWCPLHEAARAGNLVGIELLISSGCDTTSRTGRSGNGGTALWWALQRFGENHDVVALLRSYNALEDGPEI